MATVEPQVIDARPISPSQLALWIGSALGRIAQTWVEGEVTKVQASGSGHLYFTLADAKTQLDAMVWDQDRPAVEGMLAPGRTVRVHVSSVRFYAPQGRVSVMVDQARAVGEGEILREIVATAGRLAADGLTDPGRRRPLPLVPRRIGLIAGRDSDARADVVDALRGRFAPVRILVAPALVEGPNAVDSILAAIRSLARVPDVDVIVLARGGGSVEALRPFSDERLCRAIAAARTPIVTAIGHTKQRPNCDLVADASANVPRDIAALVVPSETQLREELDLGRQALGRLDQRIGVARERVGHLGVRARGTARMERTRGTLQGFRATLRSEVRSVGARVAREGERIDSVRGAQARATGRYLVISRERLERANGPFLASGAARLARAEVTLDRAVQGLDRRDGLRHGYAVLRDARGRPLTSIADLAPGQAVDVRLADGSAVATILTTDPEQASP